MRRYSLVVVGAGPRAISLLEWLDRLTPTQTEPLSVAVVDPFPPGGRVWRIDQPECLIMNTIAQESSVFADTSVPGVREPVGPSLHQWVEAIGGDADVPPWVRAEASELRPDGYATRRLFAVYLDWAFTLLAKQLRGRVDVVHLSNRVVAAQRMDGRQVVELDDGTRIVADVVMCLPGHTDVVPRPEQLEMIDHAAEYGLVYGPPGHPTEAPVDHIEPGSNVILRGLALNFHDVVATLTTGRGGWFVETGDELTYRPSGREPVLYCGSRRGIPQYSRIDRTGRTPRFRVFTPAVVDDLRERGPDVDAGRDLFPLVTKEALLAYYDRLAELDENRSADWATLVRALEDMTPQTSEWGETIAERVPKEHRLVSLHDLAEPLAGISFPTIDELDRWMVTRLDDDVEVASRPETSGRAALSVVLRDLRWRLAEVFAARGVSGGSYERDVNGWFGDLLRTISNGPPVRRTRELAALCRAGVVHFVGGGMSLSCEPVGFELTTATLPGIAVSAPTLIDCYVQRQDLRRTNDPLLRQLVASGRIRPASRRNSRGGDESTMIGAVDVAVDSGWVTDADGSRDVTLQLGGIPLEGLRWNTALAGRVGVNSEFFRETRDLARAALLILDTGSQEAVEVEARVSADWATDPRGVSLAAKCRTRR